MEGAGSPPGGQRVGRSRARPDTLPLPLPVGAGTAVQSRLEPEQAVDVEAAFDGDDWRYSVDWEGIRVILDVAADGTTHVHDERLRELSWLVPEATAAAPRALGGRAATLEGVVTLLDADGCPDLAAVCERAGRRNPEPETGSALVVLVTDLLALDGASLLGWPFDRRRSALAAALTPAPHLQRPDWVAGQGLALCEAAAQRGLGAVLARRGQSRYLPGVAAPHRLRIRLEPHADAVVVGVVRRRDHAVEALLLAEWEEGRLVDAGRAALPATLASPWLRERCRALRSERCPIVDPDSEATADVVWLRPSLVATVRHSGRGADQRLRLPSPLAIREDRPVRWCVRRAPAPTPTTRTSPRSGPSGPRPPVFTPTVLSTLPFDPEA